jgi:glycosyltransferase involved in cell wall biosynthesis
LSELAEEVGASGQLHIYPPANPSEMIQLAAEHDLGLVGEIGETPNRRIVLSNKQFIYLLAGVPAVMSDIPSHRAFAAQAPGATAVYAADDPVDLARVLDDLLSDPNRLAAARAEAFRLGQTLFNWEVEQTRLVASVEAALA